MSTLREIRDFMESMGIPGRDLWELPDSDKTFPDGAHWRVEIAGVERPSTMEAMIDEARKRDLPIHRAITTVGGSTYLDSAELRAMAQMAHDEGIEIIMAMGSRRGWDVGSKELSTWEAGIRGFLVYDEGVLSIVNKMREQGLVPKETVFKCSVFAGHCSPAGARVIESLGANTFNPVSDVSLPILASIRKAVDMTLDVYVSIVDSMGGEFRVMETPEIARVASPCYFKLEPGESETSIYKPWVQESWHAGFVREKVKMADIIREVMARHAPQLVLSGRRPADLAIPVA